ncbi:MAG: hypothetical protein IKF78_15020 [Atopobiaceae bacterium]|nr:hypothetical protein [Atopobiaceae bacterium]
MAMKLLSCGWKGIGRKARRLTAQESPVLFAPRTWAFWRNNIICFCLNNVLGHCLESLYCKAMDKCFGIIDEDYAIKFDPWYHPYWVYGLGGEVMTLLFEPIKARILARHRSLPGAMLETYAIAVLAAMGMELGFGLLVNQPDEDGNYPYWDNSKLPLNIFKQAWLVNDLVIGAVAVVHIWVGYPLVCKVMGRLSERAANAVFAVTVGAFTAACVSSYGRLIKEGRL